VRPRNRGRRGGKKWKRNVEMTDEIPEDAAMKTRTTLQKIEVLEPGLTTFSSRLQILVIVRGPTGSLVPCHEICDSALLSKVVTGQLLATIKIPSMSPKGADRESVVEALEMWRQDARVKNRHRFCLSASALLSDLSGLYRRAPFETGHV